MAQPHTKYKVNIWAMEWILLHKKLFLSDGTVLEYCLSRRTLSVSCEEHFDANSNIYNSNMLQIVDHTEDHGSRTTGFSVPRFSPIHVVPLIEQAALHLGYKFLMTRIPLSAALIQGRDS